MVAPRHAARHLYIDEPVAYRVAPNRLAHDVRQCSACDGWTNMHFAKRSVEPRQMGRLINELRAAHGANLIDAVGELVAPVLDVNARVRERHVPPIHICDARHSSALRDLFAARTRVDAERLELAVQVRALHPAD